MSPLERPKYGPPDDERMLPWYQGHYTHAFIALSPFYVIEGLDPSVCETGTLILSRSGKPEESELIEWMDAEAAKRKTGKEIEVNSLDHIAKQYGKTVSWRTICRDAGFADHCELDQALRTNIKGLRRDLEDQHAAQRLLDHCSGNRIFLPTEGRVEPIQQPAIAHFLIRTGHKSILAGDEFGEEHPVVEVQSLLQTDPWDSRDDVPKFGIRRLAALDQSLLIWVHWDSFYIAIFGNERSLASANLGEFFEGFWCSPESTTYWLTQPPIALVD